MKNEKELVYAWMNKQIKSRKLETTKIFGGKITRSFESKDIQLHKGIKLISDITGIPYVECEWRGNEHCDTNYKERYLIYNGFKFFTIGTVENFEQEDLEDFEQEDSENEKAEITD